MKDDFGGIPIKDEYIPKHANNYQREIKEPHSDIKNNSFNNKNLKFNNGES